MKSIALPLFFVYAAAIVYGTTARAMDDDEKNVRLIWFPRFSPDGKTLLTAHGHWNKDDGGEARVFDAGDGTVLKVFKHPRRVRSAAWSSKGSFIVTGDYGGNVRTFELKTGKELNRIKNANGNAENVRLSPDDTQLVVSYGSGNVRVFDLPDYSEFYTFRAVHKGGVWGMALSPNGQFAATAGKDMYATIIDLKKTKVLHKLKHPNEVNGVAFTPDNRYLATGCHDSHIRIYDVSTGEEYADFKGHTRDTVTDLQFTSDGKILVSSGIDGTVRIWDTSDLKTPKSKMTLAAHSGAAFGVAISPDNSRLATAGWDEHVKMWDLKTGELLWNWKR